MPEVLEAPSATEIDPFADIQADPFSDIQAEDDPFADIVSQSPTSETEKALTETPKLQSFLVQAEKVVENLSGMPIHQVMNSVRVFGNAAGKYIFHGLQGLEIETAKLLKNPTPEMTALPPEAVLLPQEQQDALERQYVAETHAAIPDALARAEYWKARAEVADKQSEVDPALKDTVLARLSDTAGQATAMGMEALIPGAGLPLMVLHGSFATEAEALNAGQTPEQAEAAAVRSAIGLAIFGGFSKISALGVAKLLPKAITDPSTLTKFMAQFVGQEAANETSSRMIAAWNAASDAPQGQKVEHALQALKDTTLEQSALNTAFALMGASKAAGTRPKSVTEPESQDPAVAARFAQERAVSPASEPEAAPATESGMLAETQRYVESVPNRAASDTLTDIRSKQAETDPIGTEVAPADPVRPGEFPEKGYMATDSPVAPETPRPGVSKIGQSIEAKAVEAKLTEGFSETAGYDPITIADQAQRAAGLVKSSINDAKAVIRGEAPLPEGLRGTSLITAMEEHLSRNPDAQAAYELANSPLTSATSAAAQEMRLMSERVPDGITAKFQEIREARKAGSKQRGETSERVVQDIQREMVRNASKRPTWEAWVREITC